ncbi:MAG TPA: RNA polymerase sigma factor [Clostridiales bacterium]|nr:RNA polymerase sigma factor [Clostridiales bacterium]
MNASDLSNIVELHGKAIYGFCYYLTNDKDDTEDLYQETFLKALELCHKIDVDKNPKSYIISIAIRLWKNKCRKKARKLKIISPNNFNDDVISNSSIHAVSPEDTTLSNEMSTIIRATVDSLDNKMKIPLYMFYTAEMSIEEIAQTLHIPKGTVKSRLHNARKSIKKTLEVYGYEGS